MTKQFAGQWGTLNLVGNYF